MKEKTVTIEPYNDIWKLEFYRIRAMLLKYLGHLNVGIEHIGSTSIEGSVGKPIIDIDVVINNYTQFEETKTALIKAGFYHNGDQGVVGREVFKRKVPDNFMKYHLYVCTVDGEVFRQHILFRNYMRKHKDALREYTKLKKDLVLKYANNPDAYTKGKTNFIEKIVALAFAESLLEGNE